DSAARRLRELDAAAQAAGPPDAYRAPARRQGRTAGTAVPCLFVLIVLGGLGSLAAIGLIRIITWLLGRRWVRAGLPSRRNQAGRAGPSPPLPPAPSALRRCCTGSLSSAAKGREPGMDTATVLFLIIGGLGVLLLALSLLGVELFDLDGFVS